MAFNAPFQQNMDFLNSGGGGMGFSAPPRNDRAGFGGGNRGFDFSQFPQFGQGYGSALSGGTNGYFGQGFGNSNFGQGFGNSNFGQGFGQSPWSGGGMSGGNDGQGFNTSGNFSQFTNPQQNIASPYGLTPPAGGFAPIPNDFPGLNQPLPGQSVAEMAQQNNAASEIWGGPGVMQTQGPSLNGPFQPINIGQGQNAPAPTANQGYVNQFMAQNNTAPNIGRQNYRQALRGTRNGVGA